MPRRLKSTQEKERFSLAKDRRDAYVENDKASRKYIPRSKAISHRAVCRKAGWIESNWERFDADDAGTLELGAVRVREQKGKFRKHPDTPLGRVIDSKNARRMDHQRSVVRHCA